MVLRGRSDLKAGSPRGSAAAGAASRNGLFNESKSGNLSRTELGGGERAAMDAATGRVQGAPAGSPPKPAGPAPTRSSKGPPA